MTEHVKQAPQSIANVLGRATKKQHYRRLRFMVLAIGVLCVLGIAGIMLLDRDESKPIFTTALVESGDLSIVVTATGRLQPVNQVEVGTEVSGTIKTVLADFNDRVTAGDILVKLDTEQLEAQFRQSSAALSLAQAGVLDAQATLIETKNRLTRTKELVTKGLSTDEELDRNVAAFARSEAGFAIAKAKVDQAQAQQDANRRALEKAIIRSPIDGVVLERRVEPGQTVAAALQTPTLLVLAEDLTKMVLLVGVDEADIGHIKVAQSAFFTVDAYPEKRFHAEIQQVRVAPKSIDGVVTYETLLTVDNSDLLLLPGMTATAEILVANIRHAVLVPNAALRFTPRQASEVPMRALSLFGRTHQGSGEAPPETPLPEQIEQSQVWVLEAGTPVSIPVETGATDGSKTEILGNSLKSGQKVIVSQLFGST